MGEGRGRGRRGRIMGGLGDLQDVFLSNTTTWRHVQQMYRVEGAAGDRGGFLNLFPGIISDAAPHDTVTFFILIIFTSQLHSEGEQVLPVDTTQLFWCLIDEG